MTFFAFGLNYESTSVQTKEAFDLSPDVQRSLYERFDLSDDAEVVLVSTCNRTEVYLYGTREDVNRVKAVLSDHAGQPWPERQAFFADDEEAIRHVLHVTSGIKSLVLGDGQILSQIKSAYERAVDCNSVDSLMHRLMHTAFRAAKRVATETQLANGAASVSTAAVAMARDFFTPDDPAADLQGVHVLLVGAGKMGRLALEALKSDAPASISVTNRSPERAESVATEHGAQTVPWEHRYEAAACASFVIVATGAPEPVLQASQMRPPRGRSTLLVDISMPRNIDPSVKDLDGYTVYDLDDMQAWTEGVQERRSAQVPEAEAICEEVLSDFVTWVFHQQALQPAIQAIRETFDTIREREVERHAHRTDMDREEVDRLTKSIMQKLLAVPIVKLKNVDPDSINFSRGIKLLHALFTPASDPDSHVADESPSLSEAAEKCTYIREQTGKASEDGSAPDPQTLLRDVLAEATPADQ